MCGFALRSSAISSSIIESLRIVAFDFRNYKTLSVLFCIFLDFESANFSRKT